MRSFTWTLGLLVAALCLTPLVLANVPAEADGDAPVIVDGRTAVQRAAAAKVAAGEKWVDLFNGVDLTGWTPKIRGYEAGQDPLNTFKVVDGVIRVSYEDYEGEFGDRFGHLFYNEPFSAYRLRWEYRFVGEQMAGGAGWALRNSGIMAHGQSPQSMSLNQDFPVSVEVQLLGGMPTGERSTMNMCSPGTNIVMNNELMTTHCINSNSKTFRGDQWVQAELEMNGTGFIRHYVNGELVMAYEQPQYDPNDGNAKPLIEAAGGQLLIERGTISLQSESHPVEFRNIQILVREK